MTVINMKNILFIFVLYCIAVTTISYAAETPSAEDPDISVSITPGVELLVISAPIKSDEKSSNNFTSKLTLKHKTSNPAESGPGCIKPHEAKILICIDNASYKFDAISVSDQGRIGLGNVVVSNKGKKCGELLSQIKKDHSGQHPNYKCSQMDPVAIFEVNIKYTN